MSGGWSGEGVFMWGESFKILSFEKKKKVLLILSYDKRMWEKENQTKQKV